MTTSNLNYIWVLVLNRSYEPLQICSGRRAIRMILGGRAETVEEDGFLVHSYSLSLPLPSVIRLQRFVRIPRQGKVVFSKKNVLRRDHFTCQYCGKHGRGLTIDHIIPRSRGGVTNWENVVAACQPCNSKKGNQTLQESGMHWLRKPLHPFFLFHQYAPSPIRSSTIEAWEKYVEPYYTRTK